MANIASLASGAKQDVTFTYTIKESDIGRTDLVETITASSDTASVQAASPAVKIESKRLSMSMTLTRSNNPKDGSAYAKDETVQWSIVVRNTGNQTLSNITVSAVTSGATVASGTIASLAIGGSSTKTGSYTIQESDLGSDNLTVTFKAVSGSTTVQQTSDIIPVQAGIPNPKTETEFNALSWADIKLMADDCAKLGASGVEKYKHMLGWSKEANFGNTFFGGVGAMTDCQLVGLNARKNGNNYAGFSFATKWVSASTHQMGTSTSIKDWGNSSIRTTIDNSLTTSAVPQEIKNVWIPTDTKFMLSFGYVVNVDSNKYLWIPSYYELTGDEKYGKEGDGVLDFFKASNGNKIRWKSVQVSDWWTRTHVPDTTSNFVYVTTTGETSAQSVTTSTPIPLCFCL